MDYKVLQGFLNSIIQTIQNTAISAVKVLKSSLYRVTIKNFPKTQDIKGTVVVGNQRKLEKLVKELKETTFILTEDLKTNKYSVDIKNFKSKIDIGNLSNLEKANLSGNKLLKDVQKELKVLQKLTKTLDKKSIKINNPVDVKPLFVKLGELQKWLKKQDFSPKIKVQSPKIPAPIVNVPAPVVNVKKDKYDFSKLLKSLEAKLFERNPKKTISVRLSDGKDFYEAMQEMMAISSGGGGGSGKMLRIDGERTAPLIDETNSQFVTVMPLSIIEDKANANMIYVGYCPVGTSETAKGWRISRISKTGDLEKVEWAGGELSFNKKWSERTDYEFTT